MRSPDVKGGALIGGAVITSEAVANGITLNTSSVTSTLMFSDKISIEETQEILAHEIGHYFLNGINYSLLNSLGKKGSVIPFLDEGFSEYSRNIILSKNIGNGFNERIPAPLPQAIESYDSYVVQAKNGMMKSWDGSNTGNESQNYTLNDLILAEVPVALSEERSSGFLKRYIDRVRSLNDEISGLNALTYDMDFNRMFPQLVDAFGDIKMEGVTYSDWLMKQPVMNSSKERNIPRLFVSFRDQNGSWLGSSINPATYAIHSSMIVDYYDVGIGQVVKLSKSDLHLALESWDKKNIKFTINSPKDPSDAAYLQYAVAPNNIDNGAYKVLVNGGSKVEPVSTYVVYDDSAENFPDTESKKIYVILINKNGDIISGANIYIDGNLISSMFGFYTITVPWSKKEVMIQSGDTKRTVFLSDWAKRRLVIIQQ